MTDILKIPEAKLMINDNTLIISGPFVPIHSKIEIMKIWINSVQCIYFETKKEPELTKQFKKLAKIINKREKDKQ